MKTYPIELHANAILNKIPMDNTIAVNSVKYSIEHSVLLIRRQRRQLVGQVGRCTGHYKQCHSL